MQQTLPRARRGTPPLTPTSLDTPVQSLVRLNWETALWITFSIIAVVTRLWNLGQRAMSHDESLHTLYAWNLYVGKGYVHDPMMHGPFRFHITALSYFLFGVSDFTARLPAAIFGIATVILVPLLLRPYLGRIGALVTSGMLLISPVILYHNRYIRDETFVGLYVLLMIVGLFRWLDDRRPRWLYLVVASMVLMFTTMESAYIQTAILGTFAFLALVWSLLRTDEGEGDSLLTRARAHPLMGWVVAMGTLVLPLATAFIVKGLGGTPLDYSQAGLTRSFGIFGLLFVIGAVIGLWWDRRRWPVMAAIFYAISVLLYTTFFTNRNGLATGYLGSLGYWLEQQGVERGSQPIYYYAFLSPIYEFLPLWFGLAAFIYYLFRPEVRTLRGGSFLSRTLFVPLLMWWSFLSFIGFSVAGERMPWLLYYIALPLCFLAGRFVGDFFERVNWAEVRRTGGLTFALLLVPSLIVLVVWLFFRPFNGMGLADLRETTLWIGALIVFAALVWGLYQVGRGMSRASIGATLFATAFAIFVVLTIRTSWYANYINDQLAVEFIVYAHATPDVKLVANELDDLANHLGGPSQLKIVYDNLVPWPFEWYLRDYTQKQYVGENPPGPIDAPVVLIGGGNDAKFKPYLRDYTRREYNMVWWPMEEYKNQTLASVVALLQNPAERQKWFDILVWRKYPKPLSDWYHHNTFVLYVKKDVVNRIWAMGAADPSLITANTEAAQNPYDKVRKDVTAQITYGGAGQLANPKDVALDDKGNIYVVDGNNNRIVKYGSQGGAPLKVWGSPGNGQGQFRDGPWGIAVDSKRSFVYVADTWNGRVQKFDLDGNFITAWGNFDQAATLNDKPTAMYGPRDIAVDADGNLFVTDTGNKRILKFDPDGKPLGQYGGGGFEPGKFQEPVGIAISPTDGSIYVADTWNRRVQKFDKNMAPQVQWQVEAWDGQSVVNKPYITVDSKNRVYFTDPEQYRVIVLDDKGQPVANMGQPGKDAKGIELPVGIVVAPDGKVYVADSNNNRIVQWPPLP
ncbi:MAG: TIGR03663 family protein [Anaerolineae bacterium]|nr:TIGR03663 family protein [Anaerolineae bacterium]